MARDQTGMLIIRAWFEVDSPKPLRASIKVTTDVANGIEQEQTLIDVDAVVAKVRAWLNELEAGRLS